MKKWNKMTREIQMMNLKQKQLKMTISLKSNSINLMNLRMSYYNGILFYNKMNQNLNLSLKINDLIQN